jgi:hypothetical protein
MDANLYYAIGRKTAGENNPGMKFLLFKLQQGHLPLIT